MLLSLPFLILGKQTKQQRASKNLRYVACLLAWSFHVARNHERALRRAASDDWPAMRMVKSAKWAGKAGGFPCPKKSTPRRLSKFVEVKNFWFPSQQVKLWKFDPTDVRVMKVLRLKLLKLFLTLRPGARPTSASTSPQGDPPSECVEYRWMFWLNFCSKLPNTRKVASHPRFLKLAFPNRQRARRQGGCWAFGQGNGGTCSNSLLAEWLKEIPEMKPSRLPNESSKL